MSLRICLVEPRPPGAEVACLMLTDRSDHQALRDAVMAGCSGYLLKQARGPSLAAAVRTAVGMRHRTEAAAFAARMAARHIQLVGRGVDVRP